MLLLLAFLLSKRGLTCALPILSPGSLDAIVQGPSLDITTTATTGACAGRSVWSILWSCLATTFACTWVSVHPNIPFLRDDKMSITRWRIYLMILSLIAPEIMILWAFKQCQGAVVIMKTVNKAVTEYLQKEAKKTESTARDNAVISQKGYKSDELGKKGGDKSRKGGRATSRTDDPLKWTLTHAHYLQMGGFRLHCHPDDKVFAPVSFYRKFRARYGGEDHDIWELPLSFETMTIFINKKVIDLPFIAKEEILDKCGRDALSKTIAMAQLTWFIIQIAARAHQDLAVTELELTTAALASLNIAMYISWWSKPTDILCPTIITTKRLQMQLQEWTQNGNLPSSMPTTTNNTTQAVGGRPQFLIGAKARVNLAVHYWTEFRNAAGAFSAKIIQSPWRFIRWIFSVIRALLRWFGSRLSKLCNKEITSGFFGNFGKFICMIWKTIPLTWETFTHLFLALIYYPILAILQSGSNVNSELTPGTNSEASKPDGLTDGGSLRARVKASTESTGGGNDTITPEEVDRMPTMSLITKKPAIRLVLDMGFFCEDVASAPFLCFSAFTGATFGMIHCLAWNFVFPSETEKLLWRISSSFISGLCFCIMGVAMVYISIQVYQTLHREANGNNTKGRVRWALLKSERVAELAYSAFAICFVLTRITLLSLSVIELRSLPASAFDTVQWSDFIPHI